MNTKTVHFSDYKYAWSQLNEMGFTDNHIKQIIESMDAGSIVFFVDSHQFTFTPATNTQGNRVDWGNNTYIVNWIA